MRRIALTFMALVACKDGSNKPAAGSAIAPVSAGAHTTDTPAPALPAAPAPVHAGAPVDDEAAAAAVPAVAAPAAAIKDSVDSMRNRFDADHDGKLTPDELAKASRFDDAAAVDTNHDGNISRDELEAAVHERRQQWRASHRGSGSGSM